MAHAYILYILGVIRVKEGGRTGLPRAGRAVPRDFPRAKPEENPEEQLCQPEENSVLPDSFTRIYILCQLDFLIF